MPGKPKTTLQKTMGNPAPLTVCLCVCVCVPALPQDSSAWIIIAFFSALIFLILTWILNVKSRR